MPYITEHRKNNLLPHAKVETVGELNYMFTIMAIKYLEDRELSYENLNAIMGAFDSAAKEFYRRVVVPYEEKKMRENGDVYPIDLYDKDGNINGDSGPHTLISNTGDSDE